MINFVEMVEFENHGIKIWKFSMDCCEITGAQDTMHVKFLGCRSFM